MMLSRAVWVPSALLAGAGALACAVLLTHYEADLPWHIMMRKHWRDIYEEYLIFTRRFYQPRLASVHEYNKNLDGDRSAWRVVWLRVYCEDTVLARSPFFRRTMHLINSIPHQISVAFFSVLEPGKQIPPHEGFYRGVLRYHLALEVPPHTPTQGEGDCFLRVGSQILRWKAGSDLLFDDVFEHEVQNNTPHRRVILFLDTERPMIEPLAALNRLFLRCMRYNPEVIRTASRADAMQALRAAPPHVQVAQAVVDESTRRVMLEAEEQLHRAALWRVQCAWAFCGENGVPLSEFSLDDFGTSDMTLNLAADVRAATVAAAGLSTKKPHKLPRLLVDSDAAAHVPTPPPPPPLEELPPRSVGDDDERVGAPPHLPPEDAEASGGEVVVSLPVPVPDSDV